MTHKELKGFNKAVKKITAHVKEVREKKKKGEDLQGYYLKYLSLSDLDDVLVTIESFKREEKME
jgi:predicted  nucleic acid-binding Zn-ribbon protein